MHTRKRFGDILHFKQVFRHVGKLPFARVLRRKMPQGKPGARPFMETKRLAIAVVCRRTIRRFASISGQPVDNEDPGREAMLPCRVASSVIVPQQSAKHG
jgi:hypothetical protein